MIQLERLVRRFLRLVSIDSETGSEGVMCKYLKNELEKLGVETRTDAAGNLFGRLPGTTSGEPLLFCSHMDTVPPGKGKKGILREDGRITSDGTTVLGADDAAGLAAILEALTVLREENRKHPELEILFPVEEEIYSRGSSRFDFSDIHAKSAYILDLTGPVGTAAVAAPSILSVEISVHGKASHAGFAPEQGINALNIAVRALSRLETGRVAPDRTVNFGTIEGGNGKNIVPEQVRITGEIRSLQHQDALQEADRIRACFAEEAGKLGGTVEMNIEECLRAYHIPEDSYTVRHFRQAMAELDFGEPVLITTFGGSDNNIFALHGIDGIVTACAMNEVHSVREYTEISELEKSAALTLQLMSKTEC